MRDVAILGATSAVAKYIARYHAMQGDRVLIAGRNEDALAGMKKDLSARGATEVAVECIDFADSRRHKELMDSISKFAEQPWCVYVAYGVLPDQTVCEQSYDDALRSFQVNALSVISILTLLANYLEPKKAGRLAVISSVAGDRGRKSNYIYGCAKGMLTIFLQGLRNRLFSSGVQVTTVKPGFIDTPMTEHIEKKGLLWAQPDDVAKQIIRAVERGANTVYTPKFWILIMTIIRLIPEPIFKRLSL